MILAIKGATLPGADNGLFHYLGDWSFKELFNGAEVWSAAIGQCFFSLSICMGVMTAYSSHNKENRKYLCLDEKIIGISDMLIALLGGFTI